MTAELSVLLAVTLFAIMTSMQIGYWDDTPLEQHQYYWLTGYQYLQWRNQRYGKKMSVAVSEFRYLARNHQLIRLNEDGHEFFCICVDTVVALEARADKLARDESAMC